MPDVTPDPNQQQQPPVTPSPDSQPTAQDPNAAPQVTMPAGAPPNLGQAPTQMPKLAQQPQPDKPHIMSRVFDGILKTMIGGPVMYTDPNGVRREAPQSRGAMGKAIVAAALAGLMTPTQYREGAFGTKVEDFGATAGGAAQAGKGVIDAARNQPQQLSDEEQTKRLQTMLNTTNLAKNMFASTLQKHASLEAMVDSSKPLYDSIQSYEKNRVNDQPQALIQGDLSHEDALDKLKGHTQDWTAIVTGTRSVLNQETGETEEHPVYAIVNPHVRVPLNEETVKLYSTVNPTYRGAWEATNGKVEVPLNMAVSAQNLVNEAHVLQSFADSKGLKEAFPNVGKANIAAIMSGPNGKQLAEAMDATRDAIAAGAPTFQTLNALQSAPGGRQVLNALGLDPDAVGQYVRNETNKAISAQALAKEGGVGDKAPAPQVQIDATKKALAQLPPDDQAALQGDFNPNGTTVGELKHINDKIQQVRQDNKRDAIKQGDPVELQKQATNMIEGDLSSVKDLMTARSNVRTQFNNMLQDEARKRGLDPTKYTFESQLAKADMYKDFSGTSTKTGAQLLSFNTLMGHIGEAIDANENWVRSGSPLLNKPIAWLEQNAANDQEYQRFKNGVIAPAKEYMNFLNQNHAEHESDIKALEGVLNENVTPESALTALRSFASTADIRAANFGRKYIQTVGTTYPGLITPQSADTLKRLGVKSQAAPLSVALPRGWQNGQASPLKSAPKAVQQKLFDAASGNPQIAVELARQNGWQ